MILTMGEIEFCFFPFNQLQIELTVDKTSVLPLLK